MFALFFKLIVIIICKIVEIFILIIDLIFKIKSFGYDGTEVFYDPIVIVHGGAGNLNDSMIENKMIGVKIAANIGYLKLKETGNAIDAVEEAIRSMEDDEMFNCGYGSSISLTGEIETDASIMDGTNLNAGCIACLTDIMHPISLARHLMEFSDQIYLSGDGALKFAADENFEILLPGQLITFRAAKAHNKFRKSIMSNIGLNEFFEEDATVGAVAIDENGNIAAGKSSGGFVGKHPGRICGTTVLGCGLYADNKYGGVAVSGNGELVLRYNIAQRFIQLIQHKQLSAKEAADSVLADFKARLNGKAGIISIDSERNIGVSFSVDRMPWACRTGQTIHCGVEKGEKLTELIS